MNNLKSYDEFLFEASKAKEIEDKVNDLGDPKDDKPEAEKSMKDSSEGPKEVGAEKADVKKDELKKDDKAEAEKLLKEVTSMLDKLSKRNIIHKKKAANLKSSLTKQVATL